MNTYSDKISARQRPPLNIARVTEAQWKEFDERGYVVLKNAVSKDTLEKLCDHIDQIMLGKADVDYNKLMMQLDSPDGKYENTGEQTMGHKGATKSYRKI